MGNFIKIIQKFRNSNSNSKIQISRQNSKYQKCSISTQISHKHAVKYGEQSAINWKILKIWICRHYSTLSITCEISKMPYFNPNFTQICSKVWRPKQDKLWNLKIWICPHYSTLTVTCEISKVPYFNPNFTPSLATRQPQQACSSIGNSSTPRSFLI